jgi:hypothetical protein
MRHILLSFIFIFFQVAPVFAATYYVDNAAANDAGSGAIGSPKKYIPSGIALLSASGGDTVIIKDGTYSGASNNISTLKAGISGNWNTIQAENDGGVIITSSLYTESTTAMYCNVTGLKFKLAASKVFYQTYIKWRRCAFEGGQVCSSNCAGAINLEVGSWQLFEDCWFFGIGGRYTVMAWAENGERHDIVFRRCVFRHDGGYTANEGNPEASLSIYGAYNISVQNCIFLDEISDDGADEDYNGSVYMTDHGGFHAPDNREFIGNISVNVLKSAYYSDNVVSGNTATFSDCAVLSAPLAIENWAVSGFSVNRLTAYDLSDRGIYTDATFGITNSVFWNHTATGTTITSQSYNNDYNPTGFSGTGTTHVSPTTNGILYPVRVEAASTLKTSGSSGGQMGAQIVYKVGTDGTLYGESGYNTVTANALWPWPNEARIKADFASVSGIGARGFATGTSIDGSAQSLTKYIWEYLGNQIPANIYGSGGTITHRWTATGLVSCSGCQ